MWWNWNQFITSSPSNRIYLVPMKNFFCETFYKLRMRKLPLAAVWGRKFLFPPPSAGRVQWKTREVIKISQDLFPILRLFILRCILFLLIQLFTSDVYWTQMNSHLGGLIKFSENKKFPHFLLGFLDFISPTTQEPHKSGRIHYSSNSVMNLKPPMMNNTEKLSTWKGFSIERSFCVLKERKF